MRSHREPHDITSGEDFHPNNIKGRMPLGDLIGSSVVCFGEEMLHTPPISELVTGHM